MSDVEHMSPIFTKWHIPGPGVLHRFTAPDEGPPHDHPWGFWSTIIVGGYVEEVFDPMTGAATESVRRPGDRFYVPATHIHRIVDLLESDSLDGDCWTFIEPGPHERTSGFWRWDDGRAFFKPWNGGEIEVA